MISEKDISNARILVVDDMPGNVMMFEDALNHLGYVNVRSTSNPMTVVEKHREHDFDLIILDLYMPGMNGFTVMEDLGKMEKNTYVPVLVISADPAQKVAALEGGAKDFLTKPFDMQELRARIHNMLEIRLLYRELYSMDEALSQIETSE